MEFLKSIIFILAVITLNVRIVMAIFGKKEKRVENLCWCILFYLVMMSFNL